MDRVGQIVAIPINLTSSRTDKTLDNRDVSVAIIKMTDNIMSD
jgi:hypothetical protein